MFRLFIFYAEEFFKKIFDLIFGQSYPCIFNFYNQQVIFFIDKNIYTAIVFIIFYRIRNQVIKNNFQIAGINIYFNIFIVKKNLNIFLYGIWINSFYSILCYFTYFYLLKFIGFFL